jgi:hypothetical protein
MKAHHHLLIATFLLWSTSLGRPASLLINGDAEAASLAGWTPVLSGSSFGGTGHIAAVTEQLETTGTVRPYADSYFFSFAARQASTTPNSGDHIYMFQTGTDGLTNQELILSGYFQTEVLGQSDLAEVRLYVMGATSNVVASASTGWLGAPEFPGGVWHPFRVSLVVPSGAAMWRAELHGTVKSGVFVNVFYDAVALEGVPPLPAPSLEGRLYFGLTLTGNVGRTYRIDYSQAVDSTNWLTTTNVILRASPTILLDPDYPVAAKRFYRAVELP